ncbi:coiled-coil domain-containing protein 187 isoform X3 [Corvus hawaiiensis]|uniref:coiled-coil domain-containing protein 187 isoform X3 n=1 Tax=Corvus hawaiiensis TaxID=134902 RepID=UPI002019DC56|nr:coiled-coil domain-containing protein 187 isoform X3 [Corvus hawaiiensis]
MLRQASIYTVTRSCKINQRSSGCQQKTTPEINQNICLPSKEKSAFSQLQRIENKFYHQTWSCAKSQAARRKLWHEKSFDGERNKDKTALSEKKSSEIAPAHRGGSCAVLFPARSQTCLPESPAVTSGPSRMTPLAPRAASGPCSPARNWAVDGEGSAGTWVPAKSLDSPRRDNFLQQGDSRGFPVQKEKCPCSLHRPLLSCAGSSSFSVLCGSSTPMPTALLLPTSHLSAASKARDQKQEELWRKSPQNKLEQLKKRIQEQKRKQQAAAQEQERLIFAKEPLPKRALKRKVCRVASAPPAPAYREQRERSSAQRIQTEHQRQLSSTSCVLEKAVAGKGVNLPGVSAWREGQKLARRLLGPPPPFPHLRSRPGEQSTAKTFEPLERGRGLGAMPAMESSSGVKGNEPVGKSPEFQSSVAAPSKAGRGSSAPTGDANQALRNLLLQSQSCEEHRLIRLPRDAVKQQSLGIHSPAPGLWGIPSAFSGEGIQPSLVKDGAKPSTSGSCSRGKSASPQRQKGSEKENLKQPSKRRGNLKKPHPYSPESVREFMYRKKAERKKKLLEEKKSLVQAAEMRKKRLQEVYRKQKETVGKKTCPDEMHKSIGKTGSAKGNPQCELEPEQTSGGILETSFMAWMDETSSPLSPKDHRGRNQLLETAQSPKKGEASGPAASLESQCWFLSPLKCEDLRDCSPPALHSPPLSFSAPQKDAKPSSKDSSFGLSPHRSKQDQVRTIHSLSKELAEKIDMARERLSAASWVKGSADKQSTDTTLDLYSEPPSAREPETSRDEQDRTMTVQMLLDTTDPDVLHEASHRECHGLGRIGLVGSTEGATAVDRQKEMPTPLPGGNAEREELPWITHSAGQRHLSSAGDLRNTLQGFPVHKGSKVDVSLWHEKPITSPASPAHRFPARSPQGELTAQRDHYGCETTLKVQNQEEMANQPRGENLRIWDSLSFQPSATLSTDSFEQDLGEGDLGHPELEEKHRSHLDILRQTSLLLAHKLKLHQLQQKQQLMVLKEKAKQEVQESHRFLRDLLQHNSEEIRNSRGSDPSVTRVYHAEQTQRGHWLEGDLAAASNQEMGSLRHSALKIEREHSPVDPKIVGERKPRGGGSYCSVLQGDHRQSLHSHHALSLLSPQVNLSHGETWDSGESSGQASSNSQWSAAVPHFGGSSTFHGSSLAVVEQCLRGEELRARHQAVLLRLRRKALRDRARAELAWLGHRRRVLENLQDSTGASAVAAKQHKILTELKREQAEIQNLQNIHKAAHRERKLLLKQQREILMMQHSTAQLQEKLHTLAGKQEATKSQSGSKESWVQLKNKQSKKYEGFSTESKELLVEHQKQLEESPGLEQSLRAQDNIFLPLEPTNSAGMEPIATLITVEDKKGAFLEPVLEEKALLSNPNTDPKDNEDINPYGSKYPVKGLGILPTWCNLCLVQAENTLEGIVKEVEVLVSSEIHQVDASQCLKHLDRISHEASDEELNLKAFSERLTSTESSSKSNNFFLKCESAKSGSSPPAFQKVSAVDISNSFTSDLVLELKHGEDTDVSVPEEFVCDSRDMFANLSEDMPIAISNGKETSPSDKHNEHGLPEDDRTETSSLSQKYPGDALDCGCTDHLLSFIPADEANASRTESAHSSQSENPSAGTAEPHRGVSQSCSRNKPCSQEIPKLRNDAAASPSCTDATSTSDKGLPPTDEDILSEILCPLDEVLSSGSADLPSSNKKDLSFPSEDLPPPPLGADAMKNGDPVSGTDDFPSPPEQMTGSESSQGLDEDLSLKMDALPPLPDNIVPEEFPLLSIDTSGSFSTQDGCLSEQSTFPALSSCLSEHQHGKQEMPLQHLEFLPVSNTDSSGGSKSPEFPMKQCKTYVKLPSAEEDSDDPLSSFEIGDRVLVKQSQPGTLMFKGQTHFGSGHWAGVALDKAEGDSAGTYEGVKYFECAQHCGVFVRSDEISHLLGANKNSSSYMGDEEDSDSFYDDDNSLKGDCKCSEDVEQRMEFAEEKAEDTNSAGGSEVKENQSRLHSALLSGKRQKFPHSNQCNCNEFLCQNNLMCLGSDNEKTELAQIKQRIFADALPKKSKTDEVNTSKKICCLVEDQKRIKLADDIASELSKKLLFDILIAFSETAQHKYKSAFEKDMMNCSQGLKREDNQKVFLLKENLVAALSEPSAKVSDVSLGDFDTLCIHGCHTVTDRIVTKFIDDAVKEYKKIKRKHRSKADKVLHLSPELSPTTMPLLLKILDAGVFGSSEDFDQPNSDQNVLVRQTQKQYLYKLDQWHSAPWKKTVEVPLVIPHNSSYFKNLSAYAVEELWTPENINSNFRNINVPKYFEYNDLPGNDLEVESKRMYNQVIFDLSRELLRAEVQVTAKTNMFPWMKKNVGSHCSRRHLCKRTDVSDVKIQELHKEESQWTSYGDDEFTVKMRMTEAIFDSLILDTIRVLNKIYLKKACFKGDCAPSFSF